MSTHKWSQDVTQQSDALDIDQGPFKATDPKAIALSLKRSAEHSHRRKGTPAICDEHAAAHPGKGQG